MSQCRNLYYNNNNNNKLTLLYFRMDSFVLAETFKYLYLLFSEKADLIIDIDDYVFSTEAHLLPLTLSMYNASSKLSKVLFYVQSIVVFI